MSGKRHHFKVGDLECIAIQDLGANRPMSRLFAHIPEADRASAARSLNYDPEAVPFSYTPLVIHTSKQWLLVDTGHPQGDDASSGHTLRALNAAGIAPETITTIFITHCHGDHIGGMVDETGALNYPNAKVVMWKGEWDHWMSETNLAEIGEQRAGFLHAKLDPIQDRLSLFDSETEFAPGVSAVFLPGHTPGHTGVRLESAGETLLHMVDCAHMEVQLAHPDWSPGFDSDPDQAAVTRRKVFAQAAKEKGLVMDFHFPFPSLGHIVPHGNAFKWQPVEV